MNTAAQMDETKRLLFKADAQSDVDNVGHQSLEQTRTQTRLSFIFTIVFPLLLLISAVTNILQALQYSAHTARLTTCQSS